MADHVDLVLEQWREQRPELRRSNAEHSRGVQVTLTGQGLALIDKVLPGHVDSQSQLLAGLSAAERDQLAGLLRVLLESLGDKRD